MHVIPVLDIRDGAVVHAVGGRRREYRPLRSAIAATTDPLGVVAAYTDWYPFETVYIADLTAIEGRGDSNDVTLAIADAFPRVNLWVDAGFRTPADLEPLLRAPRIRPVLGSETQNSADDYAILRAHPTLSCEPILSLDFAPGGRLGPVELFAEDRHWPATLIVMTLARVGSNAGPDWALLSDIKAMAGEREVVAAGGIRSAGDLAKLAAIGISGVLVASVIHSGGLSAADVAEIHTR